MAASTRRRLQDLGETEASTNEDVRGRKVLDNAGHTVHTGDDLMIDDAQKKTPFLRVMPRVDGVRYERLGRKQR